MKICGRFPFAPKEALEAACRGLFEKIGEKEFTCAASYGIINEETQKQGRNGFLRQIGVPHGRKPQKTKAAKRFRRSYLYKKEEN